MAKAKFTYPYPRPMVAVDIVVVTRGKSPEVLLVRRKNEPFAGSWALPGGYLEMDETLEAAARRELMEETTVAVVQLVPARSGSTEAVDRAYPRKAAEPSRSRHPGEGGLEGRSGSPQERPTTRRRSAEAR